MTTVIVDYDSGNLHSAEKSFQRVAAETGAGRVLVTSRPDEVAAAARIVLPGVGSFKGCRAGLAACDGLFEAVEEAVINRGRPYLGICVGMQMMATLGRENAVTAGFDWIGGEVVGIEPGDPGAPPLKVPHMGWNDLVIDAPHPLLDGIATGDHAYFVHSYHFRPADATHRLAHVDYAAPITAAIGRDNLFGTQFHPEKSQKTGLRLIANFLAWKP